MERHRNIDRFLIELLNEINDCPFIREKPFKNDISPTTLSKYELSLKKKVIKKISPLIILKILGDSFRTLFEKVFQEEDIYTYQDLIFHYKKKRSEELYQKLRVNILSNIQISSRAQDIEFAKNKNVNSAINIITESELNFLFNIFLLDSGLFIKTNKKEISQPIDIINRSLEELNSVISSLVDDSLLRSITNLSRSQFLNRKSPSLVAELLKLRCFLTEQFSKRYVLTNKLICPPIIPERKVTLIKFSYLFLYSIKDRLSLRLVNEGKSFIDYSRFINSFYPELKYIGDEKKTADAFRKREQSDSFLKSYGLLKNYIE